MKKLILVATPLFFIHALEEYLRGYYLTDSIFSILGEGMNISPALAFILVQVVLLLVLLAGVLFTHRLLLTLIGLIFAVEFSHVYVALRDFSFVPGFLTALPLIFIGVLYWRQLLRTFFKQGSAKNGSRYNGSYGS